MASSELGSGSRGSLRLQAAVSVQGNILAVDEILIGAVENGESTVGRDCARGRAGDQRLPPETMRSRVEVDEVEAVMQRAVGCGSAGEIEWMAHFLVDRGLKQKKRCWISCGEGGVGETV